MILQLLIFLFRLLVLVYWVLTIVRIPGNRWTEMLRAMVEPALKLTRRLMERFLPFMMDKGADWSPLVLIVTLGLIGNVLSWVL